MKLSNTRATAPDVPAPKLLADVSGRRWFTVALLTLLALSLGQRLLHLGPQIDGPHTWRQADTAQYTLGFLRGEATLTKPTVAWMGDHKTLILEFPIVEAVIGWSQRLLGPDLRIARVAFLLLFGFALWFLYRGLRLVLSRDWALSACLLFSCSPLVVVFSRALIIDFAALGLGLAGVWLLLAKSIRRTLSEGLACACLTLALLIKAPTVVVLMPLLAAALLYRGRHAVTQPWLLPLPWIAFAVWQVYVHQTNGAAPDWDFLPAYRKFDNNFGWYFGSVSQRMRLRNWWILTQRLQEMGGLMQPLLALVGVTAIATRKCSPLFPRSAQLAAAMLAFGAVLYVLVFFNLNLIHNYYQIPIVIVLSMFAVAGLLSLTEGLSKWRHAVLIALLAATLVEGLVYTERTYYQTLWEVVDAGSIIDEAIPSDALLIAVWNEMDVRSPHLLYHARRYGWSVPQAALSASVLERLIEEGADHLAMLVPAADTPPRQPTRVSDHEPIERVFGEHTMTRLTTVRLAAHRTKQWPWRRNSTFAPSIHGWYQLTLYAIK